MVPLGPQFISGLRKAWGGGPLGEPPQSPAIRPIDTWAGTCGEGACKNLGCRIANGQDGSSLAASGFLENLLLSLCLRTCAFSCLPQWPCPSWSREMTLRCPQLCFWDNSYGLRDKRKGKWKEGSVLPSLRAQPAFWTLSAPAACRAHSVFTESLYSSPFQILQNPGGVWGGGRSGLILLPYFWSPIYQLFTFGDPTSGT